MSPAIAAPRFSRAVRAASVAYPALVLMAPALAVWVYAPGWSGFHGLALTCMSALILVMTALAFDDLKRFYLLFSPLAPLALIYAGFVAAFDTVPGEGLWLALANMNVKEFDSLVRLFSWQLAGGLAGSLLYLLCTTGGPARLAFTKRRVATLCALGAIGLCSLSPRLALNSFPFGVMAEFAATAWEDRAAAARPIDPPAVRRAAIQGKEIYVLVIGEATRRDTWLAELHAAPGLAADRVVFFSDALAQSILTRLSVPMLITGTTGSKARRLPNFLHYAKAAGCTPVWLSMNDVGTPYAGIAAEHFDNWRVPREQKKRYDTDLLPLLEQVLARYEKVCVVLHTEGAHNTYVDRYPESFRAHPADRYSRQAQRAAYANAVAYAQHFLVQVIATLDKQDARSFLVFAPDHAENLWDDERGRILHGFGTRFEYEIPLVLWASRRFVDQEPDKWAQLLRNKDQPVSNEQVLPTLLDAMGIAPLTGHSLLRNHVPADRMVNIDSIEVPFRLLK